MRNHTEEEIRAIRYSIGTSNLPALTGSTSAIVQATSIRMDMLMEANKVVGHIGQMVSAGDISRSHLDSAIFGSRQLREEAPAAWWIEHRNTNMSLLLRELSHRSYAMEYGRN